MLFLFSAHEQNTAHRAHRSYLGQALLGGEIRTSYYKERMGHADRVLYTLQRVHFASGRRMGEKSST